MLVAVFLMIVFSCLHGLASFHRLSVFHVMLIIRASSCSTQKSGQGSTNHKCLSCMLHIDNLLESGTKRADTWSLKKALSKLQQKHQNLCVKSRRDF